MRIWIFYQDVFSRGGVPGEIIELAQALGSDHQVTLCGRQTQEGTPAIPYVNCLTYLGKRALKRLIATESAISTPDFILIVGFFLPDNYTMLNQTRYLKTKTILYPLAQLMNKIMEGKIFTIDPDVRQLEKKQIKAKRLIDSLKVVINPYLKLIYIQTFGKWIMQYVNYIAVFSEEEKLQLQMRFPFRNDRFLKLIWGQNKLTPTNEPNFYRKHVHHTDQRLNFIYWGRLDWHYKGLDRLLNGVLYLRQTTADMPFYIYLIGPDYRGGAKKIMRFLDTHHLHGIVKMLLPGSYPAGSKTPLRDADAAIYLSRWDGFPRTLRESISLGIPVLVSKETHFGDIVSTHACGHVLEDADSPKEVAAALLRFCNSHERIALQKGTVKALPLLAWNAISRDFVNTLQRRT